MKVIFLDIDGVLGNRKSQNAAFNHKIYPPGNAFLHAVDPDCVQRLRKLVEATGASIVISSTWRRFMDEVQRAFDWCNWSDVPIIGRTGVMNSRGQEIAEWLKHNPEVTQYVILDDDSFDIFQKTKLIKTINEYGLLDHDCEDAKKVLEE